jgi:hypothetical protein
VKSIQGQVINHDGGYHRRDAENAEKYLRTCLVALLTAHHARTQALFDRSDSRLKTDIAGASPGNRGVSGQMGYPRGARVLPVRIIQQELLNFIGQLLELTIEHFAFSASLR